jgi:hypothetical protein
MSAINYFPRWYYPISVDQTFEDVSHIPWNSTGDFVYLKSKDSFKTSTVAPLTHIPVSQTVSIRNKTWFLHCRFQLGAEPGQINGIQVQIQMDRGARIIDDTIQLDKNGELLGENQATLDILSLKTYGNTWGLNWSNIDPYDLTSGNFGLRLRFQSNFTTPHTTTPSIDFIRMRYTVVGEDATNKQEALPNVGWTMALTLEKFWDRSDIGPGKQATLLDGEGGASGTGGPPGPPGSGFAGSQPPSGFVGSTFSLGSSGLTGFIGSNIGFAGSGQIYGFIGSSIGNISQLVFIPNIGLLPTTGSFRFQAFYIQTTGQVFYWDNVWILVVSP